MSASCVPTIHRALIDILLKVVVHTSGSPLQTAKMTVTLGGGGSV